MGHTQLNPFQGSFWSPSNLLGVAGDVASVVPGGSAFGIADKTLAPLLTGASAVMNGAGQAQQAANNQNAAMSGQNAIAQRELQAFNQIYGAAQQAQNNGLFDPKALQNQFQANQQAYRTQALGSLAAGLMNMGYKQGDSPAQNVMANAVAKDNQAFQQEMQQIPYTALQNQQAAYSAGLPYLSSAAGVLGGLAPQYGLIGAQQASGVGSLLNALSPYIGQTTGGNRTGSSPALGGSNPIGSGDGTPFNSDPRNPFGVRNDSNSNRLVPSSWDSSALGG